MRVDVTRARAWIERLHGNSAGMLHLCSSLDWTGRRFAAGSEIDQALRYAEILDNRGAQGIYLRATTLRPDAPADRGRRAGASWSQSLPGLWADIDLAGPGHKHQPNRPDLPGYDRSKPLVHPLPVDEAAGRALVDEAGLLKPTLWVHSGGGLYPWWLIDQPVDLVDPELLSAAINLSDGWQRLLVGAAERLGTAYGNVGDLARVLRLPGTINRKTEQGRPCEVVSDDGPTYTFADLVECWASIQDELDRVAAEQAAARPAPAVVAPIPAPPRAVDHGASPLDAFERGTSWQQILEPHGWTVHHLLGNTTYWTRPGKHRGEGHSATTGHSSDGHDRMWVFSTSAGLPTDEPLTKPYVWGLLNGHGRDMKMVAKRLLDLGFGTRRGPDPSVAQIQLGPVRPVVTASAQQLPVVTPAVQPVAVPPTAPQMRHDTPTPETDGWHHNPVRPGEATGLPPFPVTALPPVMADLVRQVAASRQVDPTLPALLSLATVSALAAGKVRILRSGDWFEALSLYVCAVAESGERKSPVGRAVFGAVRRIEQQMAAVHTDEINQRIDELDQQRAATRGNPAAANRIEDQIAAAEASRRRPPRLKLSDDITPEAMVRALGANGGHGAVLDPEGTFLGMLCGRYTKGHPNPDLVIKAYDGDPYSADRISRDPEHIERPTLAMGLAVQQVVLDDAMASRTLLERGAMARFMYGFPVSLVGQRWEANAAPHDPNPGRAWDIAMEGVAAIPAATGPDAVPAIALAPGALTLHIQLSDAIERRLGQGGDLAVAGLKEWSHKHAGRVLRIAGLLHLAAGFTTTTELQAQTMQAAIMIGDWAIEHARHAHRADRESVEEATVKQCQQTLDWVLRTGVQHCTVREACRGVRAQWVNTKSMGDALDQLAELGWVREAPYQDRAGRVRTRYQVSPHAARAAGAATM